MNQKTTDKTIVFAVKMFSYWARNYFNKFIEFPFSISIPIDSRLTNLYETYNEDKDLKIDTFYEILAKKLNISPLHLDAVLWVNYDKLIK
jgi:DNA-(apurinic or apyrimidinic site) lyase